MKTVFITMMSILIGCGAGMNSMLDAQGKAQAKNIREATAKLKDTKGAEDSLKALNGLADDLENGTKSMKDVDKLISVVTEALKDSSISAEETKAINDKIGNLSKVRSSGKAE